MNPQGTLKELSRDVKTKNNQLGFLVLRSYARPQADCKIKNSGDCI